MPSRLSTRIARIARGSVATVLPGVGGAEAEINVILVVATIARTAALLVALRSHGSGGFDVAMYGVPHAERLRRTGE